jgi:YgiT-type zinc finger domain-containing protein
MQMQFFCLDRELAEKARIRINPMQSLEDYEREREAAQLPVITNTTGISCPECGEELVSEPVLFTRIPPMQRVTCPVCGFSKVVRA